VRKWLLAKGDVIPLIWASDDAKPHVAVLREASKGEFAVLTCDAHIRIGR
jgi:hypothetical protein